MPLGQFRRDLPQAHAPALQLASDWQHPRSTLPCPRLRQPWQPPGTRLADVAAPRQQTLRGAIEWSYALLSDAEQAMLCRLGVLLGSFTLEAVEAVAVGAPVRASEVFDVLAGLVEKSLVVSLGGGGEKVLDEFDGEDRRRWLYTAITRASSAVMIADLRSGRS